jgi:hypothetical protein
LLSCAPQDNAPPALTDTQPPLPTPASDALRVSGALPTGARLRVTLPSIKLFKRAPGEQVQLFLVMADPHGAYSYMLYPANRRGDALDEFDLTEYPLELSVDANTSAVTLWILAARNARYEAAERFGLDALAASLSIGFSSWLATGDPADDPLAAVISASDGVLYEWYAGIEALGQIAIMFEAQHGWNVGMGSNRSPDGGMNVVYTAQYVSADDVSLLPTPTSSTALPGYTLRADETFANTVSPYGWREAQTDTYTNQIIDGAYEIRLTGLADQSDSSVSWGTMEGERLKNYIVEADIRLLETDADDTQSGIWFHYQDEFNFISFAVSNRGEYRVTVVRDNAVWLTIQDWTPHPAIRPGADPNTLTIETNPNGTIVLGINGEQLMTFTDRTFDSGTIAFFCRAMSVPVTCRLEGLRVWELTE